MKNFIAMFIFAIGGLLIYFWPALVIFVLWGLSGESAIIAAAATVLWSLYCTWTTRSGIKE
jgi:hypothetical protein